MAAEGYITLEPNRPSRVSSMSHDSLRCFFLAAPLIYIATTQLAAAQTTGPDIDQLKEIQTNFLRAIDENDPEGRVIRNDRFHYRIGEIARNSYLMPSLKRVQIDHARLGKTFYRSPTTPDMQRDPELAAARHDQIIAAIADHDPETAGEIMRGHMEISRRRMTEYIAPAGLDVPLQL